MRYSPRHARARSRRGRRAAGAAAAAVTLLGVSGGAASAATPNPNFGNSGASCDSGHGAPGGLGVRSPYYWVRSDPGFGQEQGEGTGDSNSGYSASCNG